MKETRRIVMEGNLIRVERNVIEREVRLQDFIENISSMEPMTTDLLPPSCCYYGLNTKLHGGKHRLYVTMLPDHMQLMRYKPSRLGRLVEAERMRVHTLDVSWPPTLWFFLFMDKSLAKVLVRTFTVNFIEQGLDTPMHNTHLPNFYENGEGAMCVGSIGVDISFSFAKRVSLIMREILESVWNDDLQSDFESIGVTDILDWAELSKTNSNYWKSISFRPVRLDDGVPETFGSLCRRILET